MSYIYKFRVLFDEVDDFVRDIEISCSDNFEQFHQALIRFAGLPGSEMASFSICDNKWNKRNEITLMDLSDGEDFEEDPVYDEDDHYSTKTRLPRFLMSESILNKYITEPRQCILYEYDFLNPKVFYIELLKIEEQQPDAVYPRCVLSSKELPVKPVEIVSNNEECFSSDYDDGYNEEDFDPEESDNEDYFDENLD